MTLPRPPTLGTVGAYSQRYFTPLNQDLISNKNANINIKLTPLVPTLENYFNLFVSGFLSEHITGI